tara:strand:+ start:180 stop:689 length:510 start_codon:yes stop_codon:yes gene_type:complete
MAEYKSNIPQDSNEEINIESSKGEKKKVNKGCLFGCIGLPVFAFITTPFIIPMFVYQMPMAEIGDVKNNMINTVKACFVRDSGGLSTNFSDIKLLDEYNKSTKSFTIKPFEGEDSCFNLIAEPYGRRRYSFDTQKKIPWFTIKYDLETGVITKQCQDSSRLGCKKGNTW